MTVIFRDERAKAVMTAAYDRFFTRALSGARAESKTIATRAGSTHVLVAGNADGPPLLLVHGALGSSAHVLGEVLPLLERYRVYAPDVVGQSVKSADVRIPLDGPEYGEWLVDVLDGLGLVRPHVYGVSWGGFVARKLVEVDPGRIDRLVLLVPAGVVGGPAVRGFLDVGWPMAMYRAFPSEARLRRLTRALFTDIDDAWLAYFGEAIRSYRLDMRIPPLAVPSALAGFDRPTLVIGASDDISFPGAALLTRARELFPHAETELLQGCKHVPPSDAAFRARLAERVDRFLASEVPAMTAPAA